MSAPALEGALFLPYVPRVLARHVADTDGPSVRIVDASMIHVDVSGFTKLSERLARIGAEGAEQLADAIGSCFASLLEVAYDEGGSLLKFGGDALLLLYEDEGHEVRASRSAIRMRRRLREVGRIETTGAAVQLRMTVGVHSGEMHLFVVGGSHRELIVGGPGASETLRGGGGGRGRADRHQPRRRAPRCRRAASEIRAARACCSSASRRASPTSRSSMRRRSSPPTCSAAVSRPPSAARGGGRADRPSTAPSRPRSCTSTVWTG